MLTDFLNSFAGRLNGKFATNSHLKIPPHLKYVATLPCEIRMSEICIVINDKSQDSAAKHLTCDTLLHCNFIITFDGERISKIG